MKHKERRTRQLSMDISDSVRNGCGLKDWTWTFGGPLGTMDNDLLLLGDGVTMLPQMATQHPYTFPLCVYFYFTPALRKVKDFWDGRARGHPSPPKKLLSKAL